MHKHGINMGVYCTHQGANTRLIDNSHPIHNYCGRFKSLQLSGSCKISGPLEINQGPTKKEVPQVTDRRLFFFSTHLKTFYFGSTKLEI